MLIWKMIHFCLKLSPVKAELLLDTVGIRNIPFVWESVYFLSWLALNYYVTNNTSNNS